MINLNATVRFLPTPPRPPTIGPGPLTRYHLKEIARLPISRNNQYLFLGSWLSNNQIFTFGLVNPAGNLSSQSTETSFAMSLPVNQASLVSAEELPVNQLDLSVRWNPDYPSNPIKQLGTLASFIYRKEINPNQFELWISNLY